MPIAAFIKEHRFLRRLLIGAAAFLALYTVLGFLVIPIVARKIAQSQLSQLLHRQVTIEALRLNPYALSVTVQGLRIHDREGAPDMFSLKRLYVNVQLASLFKGGVVIRQVRIEEPAVHLVRIAEDRYNFSDIVDDLAKTPAARPPAAATKPTRFSLSSLELVRGRIELDDRPKSTKHTIADLNVSIPFVSNFPYLVETFVQPAFSATINGTRLAIAGNTKPFSNSLESSIEVNLVKVDLPYYLAYLPVKLKMQIKSAVLDARLKVTFVQYRDRPPRVDLAGRIALSALDVLDDARRPLLELPLLDIGIDSSDLLSSKIALDHVLVQSPAIWVRRGHNGDLQLPSLLASDTPQGPVTSSPPTQVKAAPAQPWSLTLRELKLDAARIVFSDSANSRPFQTTLEPLTMTLRNFTTARAGQAHLTLAVASDVGERLTVDGHLGMDPVSFDGTVACKALDLPRFSPYYAAQILFDVDRGTLDLNAPVRLSLKGKKLDLAITGLLAELRVVQLRRRGERDDFLRLPKFSLRETNFDLGRREVVLGDITSSGARINLKRDGSGQPWNVESLVPVPPTPTRPLPAPPGAQPEQEESPFAATVQKLELRDWSIRAEDRGLDTLATTTLDRIHLRVEGLATAPGRLGKINLQARLNETGAIGAVGSLGISPLSADVQVRLKTIPIVPLQPYFQDDLALLLTSGHVGASGRATLSSGPKGARASYQGDVTIGNVVALAPGSGEELGRFGELRASSIDFTTLPFKLSVGEIALSDYGAQVVINSDHTINLASLARGNNAGADEPGLASPTARLAEPPAPPPTSPLVPKPNQAPPPVLRIGAVVLRDGNIRLTDRSIHPAFATSLSDLQGRISGLSFEDSERASVDLQGKLGSGPMQITGRMNPLAKKLFLDLNFSLSDVDLSAMTPYAGKFAGYEVAKGQLYLDLRYLIDARRLEAKNDVKLSQFTFGQPTGSKDATSLPVRLAVSLLKDRHGVIHLDLPVSGSLDDPKFSVWGVVLMVVKNLLIKAATSPFALIGSLFGQGEELAWVEFEPGRTDIAPAARTKVDSLAKALFERPALRLEVEGHADPIRDLEAIRRLKLERKVNAQKVKEIVASGSDANTMVAVTAAEYPKYLRLAYRADDKAVKPRNALGMIKDIPDRDMEQLMLAGVVATQDDLRLLARQRAEVVRGQILHAQKIETERVFLIEPQSIPPAHRDKVADSRVDFRLQ